MSPPRLVGITTFKNMITPKGGMEYIPQQQCAHDGNSTFQRGVFKEPRGLWQRLKYRFGGHTPAACSAICAGACSDNCTTASTRGPHSRPMQHRPVYRYSSIWDQYRGHLAPAHIPTPGPRHGDNAKYTSIWKTAIVVHLGLGV